MNSIEKKEKHDIAHCKFCDKRAVGTYESMALCQKHKLYLNMCSCGNPKAICRIYGCSS